MMMHRHHMQRSILIVTIVKRVARVMSNPLTISTQAHATEDYILFLMRLNVIFPSNGIV
jgi:hypothetical protein